MDAPVYLAKEGKVSGPFEPAQIEELRRSGEFYKYEWMWDGKSPDWAPVPRKLSSPPGLPAETTKTLTKVPVTETTKTGITVSPSHSSTPAPTAVAGAFHGADIKTSSKSFCAVLFDSRVTLGGEVTQAHSRGAHFVSTPTQDIPVSKGTNALIDLLDESTDRSAKLQTTISTVSRMGDRWVLELEWAGCPLLDA